MVDFRKWAIALLLVVCALVAPAKEISPNWYPNISVDSDSQEFRDVLAFLVAHCAPTPEFEPGGSYGAAFGSLRGPDLLLFRKPGYADFRGDAILTFIGPSMALAELQSHFACGNPKVLVPYIKPTPLPPPPPPKPEQPLTVNIGDEMPGGGRYAGPGDNAPHGHPVTHEGVKYRKVVRRTPFGGTSQWYERQ
jgi:hypothetical protein